MFMYYYCYVCSILCILFHCVVLCIVCVYMCNVLLPPGVNPIAVNKYIVVIIIIKFFAALIWQLIFILCQRIYLPPLLLFNTIETC
jgi:hypothetical protein